VEAAREVALKLPKVCMLFAVNFNQGTTNMVRVTQSQQQQPLPQPPLQRQASQSDYDAMGIAIDDPLEPGRWVDLGDADALIGLYEKLDLFDKRVYTTKLRIREQLVQLSEGDAKTRRVRGLNRVAVLSMPDDSWDQSILREAWNSYPDLADEMLAISSLRVKMREYKKAVNTAGTPAFNTFRDMLTSANRGPTGTATVKIEK
jgi:hypothetical protein